MNNAADATVDWLSPLTVQPRISVLIVDASDRERAIYQRHLNSDGVQGYRILEAETLDQGLKLWRAQRPDVVLVNYLLPDGDGLKLLQAMAGNDPLPRLGAIALTDAGDERTAVRALKLGAVDYLVKDEITPVSLRLAVRQARDRTVLSRQLARAQRQEAITAEIANRMRQSLDLQQILNTVVQEVRQLLQVDRVLVYQFDTTLAGTIVAESVVEPWTACLGAEIHDTCFQDDHHGLEYRQQGRVFVAQDIYQSGLTDCHIALLERFQVRANIAVPIVLPHDDDQPLWGLLLVHQCSGPRRWEQVDLRLLQGLTVQLAIAIHQAQLYHSLQTLNASLEERVARRTRALVLSENRFRGIFHNTFQLIWLLSPEGDVLEVNATALATSGLHRRTVVDRAFWTLPCWRGDRSGQAQLQRSIQRINQQVCIRYETTLQSQDGVQVPLQLSLHPIHDEVGNVILIMAEGTNLTEAKQLEAARQTTLDLLQVSEQRYATLAEAAPVGIFRTDEGGQCVYGNGLACRIAGVSQADFLDRGWQQSLHPDDVAAVDQAWSRALATRQPFQMEYRFQRPDGTVIWVYGQATPIPRHRRQGDGYIGTMIDISDRKQTELELQASDARNRAILNAIPDIMSRIDGDGMHLAFLDTGRDFDLIPHEVTRVGQSIFALLPQAVAQRRMHYTRQALATGELQVYEQRVQVGDRWQDEEVRVMPSGPNEVLVMIRNISDRKRAERILQQVVEGTADVTGADFFPRLVTHLASSLSVSCALLAQYDPQRDGGDLQTLAFWVDGKLQPKIRYNALDTPCTYTLALGEFYCPSDVQDQYPDDPWLVDLGAESYLGVALKDTDGQVIGVLAIVDRKPFSQARYEEALPLLKIFAARATAEIQRQSATAALHSLNAHLETKVQERTAKLQASEQKFRRIFAANVVGMVFSKHSGEILEANDRFLEMLGYTRADLVAQRLNWRTLTPPEFLALDNHYIQQMRQGQMTIDPWEKEYLHRNGNRVSVLVGLAVLSPEEGLCVSVVVDISDRKRAEIALQESQQFLEAVLDTVPVAVFWKDQHSVYQGGNHIFRTDYAGIAETAALVGKTDEDMPWAETHAEAYRTYDQQVMASGMAEIAREESYIRSDGTTRWLETSKAPLRDYDGNIVGVVGTLQDISDRRRSQEILRQQLAAIEAASDGIAILQGDRYIYVNQAHVTLFGYDQAEDFLGQTWHQLYAPEELARFEQTVFPVLTTQRAWQGEAIARRRDGTPFDEGLSLSLTEDNLLICVCRDISERKRLDRALQDSEQRFRQLADVVDAVFWVISLERTEHVYVSPAYERIWGRPIERLLQVPDAWMHDIHPDDVTRIAAALPKQVAGTYDEEYRIVRPDGDIRWIHDRAFPIYNDQGQIYRIAGIAEDITDRKQAEIELQTSRAKFQRLVDDIGDQFVVFSHTGETGRVTYVSGGFEAIFGFDRAQVMDRPWSDVVRWYPEDMAHAHALIQSATQDQDFQKLDLRFTHPNGQERILHVVQHPVFDDEGQRVAIEGVLEDITDRKAYEDQLQRTNEELLRATRLKDEFLANMSHELRTPLNAVLGMTESLQDQVLGPMNARQLKALQTIGRSGTHLLALINEILDLSKIEAGQVELECAPVAIAPLCTSSLSFVKQQSQKKRLQLRLEVSEALPPLWADERRLRQVLINLLNNAVKFTPEGGQVTLSAQSVSPPPEGDATVPAWVQLAVTDTGIGISPADQTKLFQPFIQVDGALNRKYEGTGLGLALVKRITQLHGGQVDLTSAVNEGSCFTLTLPCHSAIPASGTAIAPHDWPLPAAAAQAEASPPSPPLPVAAAPRILLVEDNEANVLTTVNYLETKGYHLKVARNGEAALQMAIADPPDLILMDIQMPDIDGLEVTQRLRQYPELQHIPIIALTALAMEGDRDRCLAAGANDYLSKPIRFRELNDRIHTLLHPQ
jgi:PAS domain S-box-containing protein